MKFGLNYNLYNSSYHIKKSALYSYKANNYLNNCGHNIKKIVLTPRFIGLATCTLLLVAASFLPFFHSPTLSYLTADTIALISGDPAFIFTGAIFSSGQYYSLLDKAKVFCATIILMDDCNWGMKIAECFVENIKNLCACTSYQFLSWGEYFKSRLSDFFKINKANDEILDIIPEEKIITSQNAAEKICMYQQYVDFHHAQLVNAISSSSKNIAAEGGKLLGVTALMSLILCAAQSMIPLNSAIGYGLTLFDKICYSIALIASLSPLSSSDYVQKHCNGDVFSLKSINYHLLQYANKEIYNEFINQLGTGVILSLGHSALMAYHAAALYSEQKVAKYILEGRSKKIVAVIQKVANYLLREGGEETLVNIQKDAQTGLEDNSQEISMNTTEEVVTDQLLGDQLLGEVEQVI